MSALAGVGADQLVVLRLETMLAVAAYLAQRPYVEVAPLAGELAQLTTLEEHLAAEGNE